MPKFIIERNIPNAGKMTGKELHEASQISCAILQEMGPQIQWIQSYVTDDAIYCTYIAPDDESIRQHARRSGFPADKVMQVHTIIDPTTAE